MASDGSLWREMLLGGFGRYRALSITCKQIRGRINGLIVLSGFAQTDPTSGAAFRSGKHGRNVRHHTTMEMRSKEPERAAQGVALLKMYSYPPEFPENSRARIQAEKIRAGRDFEGAKHGARHNQEVEALFRTCVLRVFLVFAEEAAELTRRGTWSVGKMETEANEFVRQQTIEVYYEKGRSPSGSRLKAVTSSWRGSILPAVQRQFEQSPQWAHYEDLLLEVAEAQSVVGAPDSSGVAADPEAIAGAERKRGYRTEVRKWMELKGLKTLELAAKDLGVSLSALKSIMSDQGKRRCSEATLRRVLGITGYKGE
jgi:hypothetical protein